MEPKGRYQRGGGEWKERSKAMEKKQDAAEGTRAESYITLGWEAECA